MSITSSQKRDSGEVYYIHVLKPEMILNPLYRIPPSPLILLGVSIGAIVSLVTLICKRHDSPANLYLLAAFVSVAHCHRFMC